MNKEGRRNNDFTLSRRLQSLAHLLGFAGIVGEILLIMMFVILHVISPDISPTANYISDYANGAYGSLFRFSLIAHGIGMISLAAGLAIVLPKSASRKLGTIFLGTAAIGTVLGGIFSVDPRGAMPSVAGIIHEIIAFSSFIIETGATIFLCRAFRRDSLRAGISAIATAIAVASVVSVLWFNVSAIIGWLPGIAERATFIVFFVSETLIAIYLLTYKISIQAARCKRA